MFTNVYAETYKQLIQEEKKKYKVVLKDNPEEVLGEFSNGASSYYFCQDYTKKNLGVPVNVFEISADGTEKLLNTFVGTVNARQNFHMSDYNAYSKRLANKERYQAMAAASAEKRQAKSDLREKIKAIRDEATAKIAELKAEIERIRLEANDQILTLKGKAEPTEGIESTEAEISDDAVAPVDIAPVTASDEGIDINQLTK